MTVTFDIVNPLQERRWDELLLHNEAYSFFHSSSWARVLSESYRYQPRYVVSVRNGRLSVLLPFMEITSAITGRRGVSLPFSDYCEPVLAPDIPWQDVRSRIVQYGEESGWRSIEVRGGQELFKGEPHSSFYFGHTLDLSGTAEQVFAQEIH